jgi:hypothetical protein
MQRPSHRTSILEQAVIKFRHNSLLSYQVSILDLLRLCLQTGQSTLLSNAQPFHGPGFKPRWEEILRTHKDRFWGTSCFLYGELRVSFVTVKRQGRGVDHPPSSSAEAECGVELQAYIYLSPAPAWYVTGNLPHYIRWLIILKMISQFRAVATERLSEG